MTFALAAALGCDLFDSAAYALYARDDRYLTPAGTEALDDLAAFPCACPVCTARDPAGLRAAPADERERLLAEHNLHVTLAEVRRVRQAVRSGNLLELVERRARGHPSLVDGYRALLDEAAWLERFDPASKGTVFVTSAESARRPEVRRHHDRLARVAPPDDAVVLLTEGGVPSSDRFDAVWRVRPPFGPFPRGLAATYPLTAETPARADRAAREAAATGVARLADATGADLTLAHDDWPATALARVPETVRTERLAETGGGPTA
jgi:7-cyano-7-deazaguanine tRNA-ribosyltransferase